MRTIINECVHSVVKRAALNSTLYVLTLIFLLLETLVILTFEPNKGQSAFLHWLHVVK